jgi:hypothetical protein
LWTDGDAVLRSEARADAKMSGSTLEGYVRKRGQLNPVFKERYFVLEGHTLKYFKTKQTFARNQSPQGTLDCHGLVVAADPSNDTVDVFNFIIETANGTRIECACDSSQARHTWLQALGERTRVSHSSIELHEQHAGVRPQTDEAPILRREASSGLEGTGDSETFGVDAGRQMRAALSSLKGTTSLHGPGSPCREDTVFQIRTQVHTFVHAYCI